MAIHATSTTAPAVQTGLLPFAFRPAPPVDDPRSADELLEEIQRTIGRQEVLSQLAKEPQGCRPLLSADVPHGVACGPMSTTDVLHGGPGCFDIDTPAIARAIHFRRELQQALDYGFALLDALDLPPLALDVIDDAIATLDAIAAPGEDLEDGDDLENDMADLEPSLASPERHPNVPFLAFSRPYTDRGPESSQLRWAAGARHDGEAVNEDGDDLDSGEHDECDREESIGWPNDFHAKVSTDSGFYVDLEAVNEDGDDCGEADKPWWDRIGYEVAEVTHV